MGEAPVLWIWAKAKRSNARHGALNGYCELLWRSLNSTKALNWPVVTLNTAAWLPKRRY